jgi:hypothetical protein
MGLKIENFTDDDIANALAAQGEQRRSAYFNINRDNS